MESLPIPGDLIDIGGRSMHLLCNGSGSPAIILDSGTGGSSLDWSLAQPRLARMTFTCSYDRLGLGWSDAPPPGQARTSSQMVDDLHELLVRSKIRPPYILVGHSLGGLNGRLFAYRYRQDMAGLVLVDAAHEEELTDRFPKAYTDGWYAQERSMYVMHTLARAGILRWIVRFNLLPGPIKQIIAKLPPAARKPYRTFLSRPAVIDTIIKEMEAMPESYEQARQVGTEPGSLGDLPLVVIKHGSHLDRLPKNPSVELVSQYDEAYHEVQNELACLSSNHLILTAAGSGHSIQIDQPERVVEAVRWVLERMDPN